jgi:hypothetical protein
MWPIEEKGRVQYVRRIVTFGTFCGVWRQAAHPEPRRNMIRAFGIRKVRIISILTTLGLVVALPLVVAPGAAAARTLLVSPTRINAFAQDGPYIAWNANGPNVTGSRWCGQLHIRSLATGRQRSFGTATHPVCSGGLALGGKRALWTASAYLCGNCQYSARVFSAALDDPRVVPHGAVVADHYAGTHLTGLAADQGLLAFSRARYNLVEMVPSCFDEPVPCVFESLGGSVTQVAGRDRHQVPGVGPPAVLAVGGGRIAIAPSDELWEAGTPDSIPPVEDGPVHVVDPTTGTTVATVFPTGMVRALALTVDALAVFVEHTDGTLTIERYALPAGTPIASTVVNEHTTSIDMAGKWIVYTVNRTIRLIDPLGDSRRLIRVGRDKPPPVFVSIEGRRVAWVENGHARHRIRAILAPE